MVGWRQVMCVVCKVSRVWFAAGIVDVCFAGWIVVVARNLQLTLGSARMQLRQVVNVVEESCP